MTRRVLRALLSSLLLTACTSRDPPAPGPDQRTPPEPTDSQPVPPPTTPPVAVDVPQGAQLEWVRANACEDGAPMSLTASDGTGLRLAALTARAVVEGPLAFTELRLSFDNPEDRQLEGRFAITLPPGAALSRFAMQIDGRWQEGEVVERQAARAAYEDFLHRRQDPALLEKSAGNVFRARVFPIPPRARKELVLSYSQAIANEGEPYRLPLCGLPELDLLDVDVAIVKGDAEIKDSLGGSGTSVFHLALRREHLAPTKDLEARLGEVAAQGLRHGDLVVARVVPQLETPAQPVTALTVLIDTSASRALDFGGQVDRLGALISALPPEAQLHLVAYDQTTEALYSGQAGALPKTVLDGLRQRGALGASDLGQALTTLPAAGLLSPRIVLVGDGVVTAGEDQSAELATILTSLAGKGLTRVDAVVDGGIQDTAMLTALTRAGLRDDGVVLDARLEATVLAARLGQATRSGIRVTVPGAEWVWPTTLDGVQAGDERLLYVQLPPDRELEVQLQGATPRDPRPTLAAVPEPLVARAHAQARIADLEAQRAAIVTDDAERRKALKNEIITLSTRHRVLSDFTALLVLETEADYARFGIDRKALADVLTVGPAGVQALRRLAPPLVPVPDEPVPLVFKGAKKEAKTKVAAVEVDGRFDERMPGDGDDDEWAAEIEGIEENEHSGQAFGLGGLGLRGEGRGGGGERARTLMPPAAAGGVVDDLPSPDPEPVAPATGRVRRRPAPSRRPPSGGIAAGEPPIGGGGATGKPPKVDPHQGRFGTVMDALARADVGAAELEATKWRTETPGDVLALVALGEVAEARGQSQRAARAYGSLIDLFPSRADIRRMAGERLERLGGDALSLAIDTYAHGVEQRPDHPSSHRLYAYALLKAGRHAEAFAALEAALGRSYPGGRFRGVDGVLRDDLGLVGAAWLAVDPAARKTIDAALTKHGVALPAGPSIRFVLNWETDANDVDLHVYDAKGGHAFYSSPNLGSGGRLFADVTTGYGPECFAIDGKRRAGPYRVMAHYYRRGPMGYGMGKLQVVEHDGAGHLRFSENPFVIMKDDGYVDLVTVGATLAEPPAFGDPEAEDVGTVKP